MEESSLEWEIQDCSTCLEDAKPEKSNLGWISETGLNLGKKFVITGVVVSTVSVVLPPLIVVSAIGIAFSVPFGFVFASYVCTEKLLRKLLPTTSLTIDYAKAWPNGENEVTYATDKEGRGEYEDMGDWIEMSIALADNDDGADLKYGQSQQEKLFSGDQFISYKEGHEYDELTVNKSLEGKQSGEGEEPSSNITAREAVVARDAMPMEGIAVGVRNKEDKKTEERNNVPVERSSIQGRPGVAVENVDFAEDEDKKNVNGRNEIQHDVEDKNTKMDKVVMGMKGRDDMKRQTNAKGKGGSDKKGKKKTSKILSGERRGTTGRQET